MFLRIKGGEGKGGKTCVLGPHLRVFTSSEIKMSCFLRGNAVRGGEIRSRLCPCRRRPPSRSSVWGCPWFPRSAAKKSKFRLLHEFPHRFCNNIVHQVAYPHGLLLLDVGDVAHDDVDEGVLHQREEHEHGAAGHEHIDGLERREVLNLLNFILYVLSGKFYVRRLGKLPEPILQNYRPLLATHFFLPEQFMVYGSAGWSKSTMQLFFLAPSKYF